MIEAARVSAGPNHIGLDFDVLRCNAAQMQAGTDRVWTDVERVVAYQLYLKLKQEFD